MPPALTTVATRAAEGARAAFRPAELPLKDDCRRESRGEQTGMGRRSAADCVGREKKVTAKKKIFLRATKSRVTTRKRAPTPNDVRQSYPVRRVGSENRRVEETRVGRKRLAIAGKKPSVRGVTRVSAVGDARSRRTRGARGRAATYLGQHGRVDSENLRFEGGGGTGVSAWPRADRGGAHRTTAHRVRVDSVNAIARGNARARAGRRSSRLGARWITRARCARDAP